MAHDFRRHHFEHSGRPSGTGNLCGLNPALKCRAIVTTSLCDGERDRPGCRFRRLAENHQQTNLSNDGSGATPELARETRALPS
jgi:hypothetical protein